jgi:acetyl esterase
VLIAMGALALMGSQTLEAKAPPKADPQMQAVLNRLKALEPKPIEKLTPAEARKQPTPADANEYNPSFFAKKPGLYVYLLVAV